MRFTSPFLPSLAAVLLAATGSVRGQETPVTPIGTIRELSAKDAASGRSVRIHGVVTYLAPNGALFFVQDETGGICVSGPRERPIKNDLKTGAWVEIEGMTASGRTQPYITARRKEPIRVVQSGEGVAPVPREATIPKLQQPAFQGVRVEISGVVRTVASEPFGQGALETLLVTIADDQRRLVVALPGWRGANPPTHLVGAQVRVRGVFHTTVIERQAQFANRLLISGMKDLQVEEPSKPPYEMPLLSIESARDAAANQDDAARFRLRGTVTVSVPGKGFYIEDDSGAIFIAASPVAPNGERVEVAGFPALRDNNPTLEDSVWRVAKHTIAVEPPLVTPELALSGALSARMVQIDALLLAVSSTGEGPTLVLQGGERVFLARSANANMRLPSVGENSWLRVTGVCVNTSSPQVNETASRQPASFHLLLAGPQAVQIARTPSWWTLRRVMMVIGSLAALTCAAIVWATTLRRRVTQQTSQIREHLAREAVAEERLRIARELHDSVQQDLLGITMQIKATDRLLESDKEKARSALNLASAMVRRSQAETHRAVWDLRDSAHEHTDLVTALAEMLAGLSTDEGAKVELVCTDEPRGLPAAVESQLLRVAQEAVTNALKHAEARRIEVELRFSEERLTLIVRDDGRGFDADHPPSASSGHFGLFGMRERAIKLEADLRVTSQPGQGTAVQIDVPLASPTHAIEPVPTPSGLRLVPRPSIS